MSATVRIVGIFNLLLCFITAQGQVIYFDKMYDSGIWGDENEGIWGNVLRQDNSYIFLSFTTDQTTDGRSSIYWVKTDLFGDILETSVTDIDTMSYWPTWMLPYDSGYYAIGLAYNLITGGDLSQYFFMDFDLAGNKKSEYSYGELNRDDLAHQLIRTYDNGFAIIGQSSDSIISTADIYLVKIDSLRNFQWEKYYGGVNFDAASSIIQTSDSGYLLFGWTRSFGNGQRDFYLVKTDSAGNQQWDKTYGSGSMESGWGIIELEDENYLLTGAGEISARMIKINIQGDIIWQKSYSYEGSDSDFFYWAHELNDNSIVAVGGTNNIWEGDAGYLVKTDSAGNLQWERKYNKSSGPDLFHNVLKTIDGGFLLSGQCINISNGNQDGWLVKVDSLGCPYADCIVGIDEAGSKKVIVDVYVVRTKWTKRAFI